MPFDGFGDPHSLQTLEKWLRTQPGEKTYRYSDINGNCLLGQYAKAMNKRRPLWKKITFFAGRVFWKKLSFSDRYEPFNTVAFGSPRTFSGALTRAARLNALLSD